MRPADSLSSIPPHFVAFAWRYRSCARWFAPVSDRTLSLPARGFDTPVTLVLVHARRRQGLAGSWGTPLCACLALRPRWDFSARPLRRVSTAFRNLNNVGSHDKLAFEAQSHGLFTRCLRFVASVATDGARLASGCWPALPGGIGYPLGSSAEFQSSLHLILTAQA